MSKRGRKPTPTKIRVLRGNPGHRPINELEPKPPEIEENAKPTETLTRNGKKIWERVTTNLRSVGLLTDFDLDALTRYVVLIDEWQQAVKDVRKEGRVVTRRTQYDEYQIANPRFSQMLQLNRSLKEAEANFGFNPSARSTLIGSTGKETPNEWENFLFGTKG